MAEYENTEKTLWLLIWLNQSNKYQHSLLNNLSLLASDTAAG